MINNKLEDISQYAYSTKQTIYNTFHLVQEMIDKNIEGDFAECGVGAGSQIMAMKVALGDSDKIIHAFDSFEGIPMAGEHDEYQPGIGYITHNKMKPISERLVSSGIASHSMESVQDLFKKCDVSLTNVKFIKGWFQDIVPVYANEIKSLAMLRLDGDLYESNMVCMQNLYPKLSVGGVVIVDDQILYGARKAIEDYLGHTPDNITVEGGGGVVYFYKK